MFDQFLKMEFFVKLVWKFLKKTKIFKILLRNETE